MPILTRKSVPMTASGGPLVDDPANIRLGFAGLRAPDYHPYSWSAILNGYDREVLAARCPCAPIIDYLGSQPPADFGVSGARVTHIWCDDRDDAERVASCCHIANIAASATDLIGAVDAVLIPVDIGGEHVERARPFIEAGVPVFIDKPLVDNLPDLQQFIAWHAAGHKLMSSSGLRYSARFAELRQRLAAVGTLQLIVMTMGMTWEQYAIHALESVYPFLPPGGWLDIVNTGTAGRDVVHLRHASGVDVMVAVVDDMDGGFGCMTLYGTEGHISAQFDDSFQAFKAQLTGFITYLQTGTLPFPFSQTVELMRMVIGGLRSRDQQGRRIDLTQPLPS
jgi:hypothetical protein